MDLITMNDESFNLSDDFFDALSVIATTNPGFANIQQQQQQQPNPQMTTQCLIEEQQQRAPQFTPQPSPQLQQQQQLSFQQQQQRHMFREQQQQMIQQVAYQQQRQRQFTPQQQSMIQQKQRILAAYQQQQQYRSSTPAQNQPLNFVPQQQQQTTAQQPLYSQQHLQYQQPAAPQLQSEQSHALQLASQLQYQQTQSSQLPSVSHVQDQQNPQSTLQYPQAQNRQSRAIQFASQLQLQQQSVHQIQNNQPQVQNQNLQQIIQNQQLPVPQLQQQLNVDVPPPQIQVQLQNKQATQVQQSIPQQPPIQLTVAQQRLIDAHQQQQQQQQPNVQTSNAKTTTTVSERVVPHIEIVEQPAPRASRFRYNCEVRDSGSIPGVNSTLNTKTFPTIRIVGYNGNAMIVVSCVTKDPPYRPHPHNLVGRSWCKNGICKVSLTSNRMSVTFDKLGIQCIKRKDFPASLEQRRKEQVDPFGTGFGHKEKDKLASIDQNCVRLAFQAFLEGPKKGEYKIPLPAIVSDPIHDKKNSPDLTIHKISHCSAPAAGDLEMILLCDRVTKEDIRVRFYEERDEEVVWEESVDVSQTGAVHKYVAIVFRSPKYHELDFSGTIHAKLELVRPSDGMYSNSLPFDFTPQNEPFMMQRKRKRLHESLLTRDLEAASTYSDQWNAMSHFNIIEAR